MTYTSKPGSGTDTLLNMMEVGRGYTTTELAAMCGGQRKSIGGMMQRPINARLVVSYPDPNSSAMLYARAPDPTLAKIPGLPFALMVDEFPWPPAGSLDLANGDNLQRWYA